MFRENGTDVTTRKKKALLLQFPGALKKCSEKKGKHKKEKKRNETKRTLVTVGAGRVTLDHDISAAVVSSGVSGGERFSSIFICSNPKMMAHFN